MGVITIGISRLFISIPPHPAPLPRGEREFPDENNLKNQRIECRFLFEDEFTMEKKSSQGKMGGKSIFLLEIVYLESR